jgi:hypothetical protein
MSPLARRTSARPAGSGGGRGVVGHNLGTFLQRARSGRGCSARASAGIERSQLRTDWIAMPSPGIIAALSTPAVGTRSSWASGSESDDGTRLSFRSTNPGREVSQPNAVVGLCHGLAPLPARRLRPCPADRWSSRAPPPFHPGRSFPYFTSMLRCLKQHALPLCAISASKTRIQLLLFNRLSRRTTGGKERRGQQVLQVRPRCRNPMKSPRRSSRTRSPRAHQRLSSAECSTARPELPPLRRWRPRVRLGLVPTPMQRCPSRGLADQAHVDSLRSSPGP